MSAATPKLIAHLRAPGDVISPENGFALYFLGCFQLEQKRQIDPEIIDRLRSPLETSDYWRDRFRAFGPSLDHLTSRNSPDEAVPLLPANVAAELTATS